MKIFKFLWISTSFKVFKALRRLPKRLKTLELRSGDTHKIQMFLKCFWFLRKPSDQKYFYWWTVRLHLNFYVHKNLKMPCTFCLAKISMECMERFKRSKMCGLGGELYEIFKFLWISTSFKVFKALRRLPKRLKTLELRSGDTHKIQMFLKCFWLLRKPSDQKIFLLMNGSITFEFLCPQKFEDYAHFA